MLNIKHSYSIANTYDRRDLEEEVQTKFGLTNFCFSVVEHYSGNFLTLSIEDLESDKLCNYIGIKVDEIQELEDVAFALVKKLKNIPNLKRLVLLEEDREVLLLA